MNTQTTTSTESETEYAPLRVSIQGYAGAFHEIAARNCFDHNELEIVPAHTFDDLVEMIEKGEQVDVGLMAIENTLAGSLMNNYHLLNESKLRIVGEVYLRIKLNLMTLPGVKMEELTEVRSHPIAMAQCRAFFRQYPHIRLVETVDTALSAKMIQEDKLKTVGAVASTLAAELYGLEVLAAGIETNKKNHTRFLVLNREEDAVVEMVDKVSLCFATDHEVGSLHKVLAVLAAYNVNLTKIQSAPIIGRPWEYMFFVDFVVEGKVGFQQALDAITPLTRNLKILGTYQRGRHFEY